MFFVGKISRRNRGFSLIELLFVLAIAGFLLSFAYPRYARGQAKGKGQALGGDVVTLAADISASFNGNLANVSDANIISGSLLKNIATITNNGGTLTTNMGGTISCSPSKLNVNNDSFTCVITDVKDGACEAMGTALGRAALKLSVAGTIVKAPGTPMDSSKVTCSNDSTQFDAVFN